MNTQAVIEWLKHNVLIVVFGVLVLAAPAAMWFVSGSFSNEVRAVTKKRAEQFPRLKSLERADITPPGDTETRQGILNQSLLDAYRKIAEQRAEDARAVKVAAVQHNQKGRTVLLARLFPAPPMNEAEVLPRHFHEALVKAYQDLLAQSRAGMPPSVEAMRDQLDRERAAFIIQDLRKDPSEKLEPEEQERLRTKLGSSRMARYAEAAEHVAFYASLDRLRVPEWTPRRMPSMPELFNWQWQYWVTADIIQAVRNANAQTRSATRAPVKEIVSIAITGLPGGASIETPSGAPSGPAGGSGPAGFGFGMGGGAGGMGEGSGAPAAPAPAGEGTGMPGAGGDYSKSVTGRKSTNLYDVVNVDLELIVETRSLPSIIDAFAMQNFMTVTSVKLDAVDPYDALVNGFFYGPGPVCRAVLRIETVWLREWTTPFMPPAVKQALGIQEQQPVEGEVASM